MIWISNSSPPGLSPGSLLISPAWMLFSSPLLALLGVWTYLFFLPQLVACISNLPTPSHPRSLLPATDDFLFRLLVLRRRLRHVRCLPLLLVGSLLNYAGWQFVCQFLFPTLLTPPAADLSLGRVDVHAGSRCLPGAPLCRLHH